MNELLIRYVSVSFSAALLMTALMLLRPLYKNRFSKYLACCDNPSAYSMESG